MTFLRKSCRTINDILVRAGYMLVYCEELPDGKHRIEYSKTCAGITISKYYLVFSSKNRCIQADKS